ncbi:hypothetical protein [Streptomyces cyaneochromogenes]|uniref:hypothetical protein n=1 Tax=Streptomyces cyaneochromogenes TaxID=2496836 RepID=UPI00158A5947|nr:hypothetical protein [Streptomyces cyaneochromogenes]
MPTRTFVGLGSGLDPPGLLELCLADDPPAMWRTRPNIRVVLVGRREDLSRSQQ